MTYDIGIIGGGVHGASAAHHFARRGVSTIVFERGAIASGPTGRGSGIVRSYYTNPFLAEVARDGTTFLAEFASHTAGGSSGYQQTGGLYLHGPQDIESVAQTFRQLEELGIDGELLTEPELISRFPDVDFDGVAVGVWEERAGYADPAPTAIGLLISATQAGVTLLTGSRVTTISESSRSVVVTLADGSRHEVGQLLIAAGPWTSGIAAQVGADLPLTAERHVVAGLRQSPDTAGRAFPHVLIDVAKGYYSRPRGDDEFLLGPLAPTTPTDPDSYASDIKDSEFEWLKGRALARVPIRSRARRSETWASLYDVSPDWQPVIGQVSEHTFVDAGTSGHGFKLAPVLGDHVARMLLGSPDPRLAQFSPDRFADGRGLSSGFGAARILG